MWTTTLSLGVRGLVTAWAKWRHTLEESKRLAIKAVDEYNSSSGHYTDFIGTMVRAWLYLFQAEYQRYRRPHWHVDREGNLVMKDGEPKSWELAEFAKDAYAQNDATRVNLELFILLRNKVEHRYESALKEIAGGRAHALVINYEHRLTEVFGEQHSLARRLRFPLFLESLKAPEHAQAVTSTSAMKAARTMLTTFDAGLDESVLDDNRYDYRIRLVPTTSSKMDADAAYEFVNLDAATPEERDTLIAAGRSGKVLTKVRTVSVGAKGTMLPKAVVAAVQKRVPYEFNYAIHTAVVEALQASPLPVAGTERRGDRRQVLRRDRAHAQLRLHRRMGREDHPRGRHCGEVRGFLRISAQEGQGDIARLQAERVCLRVTARAAGRLVDRQWTCSRAHVGDAFLASLGHALTGWHPPVRTPSSWRAMAGSSLRCLCSMQRTSEEVDDRDREVVD